ncbi:GntR family transcriptional regulator [Gluconacetobacter sacchari DSM 12717]|uniref:GntR family transcriptional regulator n=2 Tax=Gluconacetobacter sacchari TaxID=92759 RepID=A0A7W4IAI4_9PROT|nr:GntR family transcriptional regulator [Gluconacetobacter sacchari]MBB2159229.1 GntR family transcriptional regulator [Gluconacetobacter sacchari]GBQ22108.1 GntR family transcriptional regulator [Gluconacetobacter sacchari DSM 12717]
MDGREDDDSARSLGEALFRDILALIHSGGIAPGATLGEATLARQFGVSRGPVREAIRRLQGIGLVTREPFARARIALLDRTAVDDLFDMRVALEGRACALAATRMDDHAITTLLAALERARRRDLGDPDVPPDDFDFHLLLIDHARSPRISAALGGDLYPLLRLYRRWSGARPERKGVAYQEHWQILRAIRSRDADLARSLMEQHIEKARANLMTALDASPTSQPVPAARLPAAPAASSLPAGPA